MAGINTCRPHMFKARRKGKHSDLMQLLWSSDGSKISGRQEKTLHCVCKGRCVEAGWRPGTPWRCWRIGSNPSFAYQLEQECKCGCLQAVSSKKIWFLHLHFSKRLSLEHVLKIPPVQQCGSESIWPLAALVGKYSSVSKLFLNPHNNFWTWHQNAIHMG